VKNQPKSRAKLTDLEVKLIAELIEKHGYQGAAAKVARRVKRSIAAAKC